MHRALIAASFILAVLLASCSPATSAIDPTASLPVTGISSPTPMPTVTALPTPEPTPTASPTAIPTAPPTATSTGSTVEAILARAAVARGLPVKQKVAVSYLGRDELRPYLVQLFEKEHARQDLEKDKALFVLLNLLKAEDDLYDLWLGLLTEQMAGFFEFDSHEMKLVTPSGSSVLEELTLAHEYVHALQDQHFGLGAKLKQVKGASDRALALRALCEGDATLAMLEYARQSKTTEQLANLDSQASGLNLGKLRSAPLILQVSLLFPYQQGTTFVGTLFRLGGWAAVNNAYANPPQSSEQIMHPEKYLAGEASQNVEVPDVVTALGPQWSLLDSNTFGELGWLVYLATGVQPNEAVRAAGGWGGDRYALLKHSSGKCALAALTAWDTPQDASEFYTTLLDLQASRKGTKVTAVEQSRLAWEGPTGSGYVSVKGNRVLLVVTPDEATTKKAAGRFSGF